MGIHQGLAPSPFLFAVLMDRLTGKIRRESLWIFADDIVICSEIEVTCLESSGNAVETRCNKIKWKKGRIVVHE